MTKTPFLAYYRYELGTAFSNINIFNTKKKYELKNFSVKNF